jgi:hypothetical protein
MPASEIHRKQGLSLTLARRESGFPDTKFLRVLTDSAARILQNHVSPEAVARPSLGFMASLKRPPSGGLFFA